MMNTTAPYLWFPDGDTLAQAFFEEGIRHLENAHVLHEASRYPAAIASAMKAAEFGVKSVIMLAGAMGWWEKIFTTHSPLSDINSLPVFQHHVLTLQAYDRALFAEVMVMEKLAPARPGGAYKLDEQENPEYPFLSPRPGYRLWNIPPQQTLHAFRGVGKQEVFQHCTRLADGGSDSVRYYW